MAELSQDAERVDLSWTAGDPVSMAFTVADVNWAGTYKAQVRDRHGTLVGTLTVTATYTAPNTTFTLTMSALLSTEIAAGSYRWDLQQVGGVTRLRGHVNVGEQVTT